MNKLEASISLLIITCFAAAQYMFLAGVPEDLPHFAFLCITNFVGFLIALSFFFGELFRLDARQVKQSMVLAAELVAFNMFMLLGASGAGPTNTAAVLSVYFVFVVAIEAVFLHRKPTLNMTAGVAVVFAGVFLATGADLAGLANVHILYLIAADAAFALYIITAGAYAVSSNPSILAMGQMFFCFVFSLAFWGADALIFGASFSLPADGMFWGSVIFISFFIRGLYTIVQIYAQRYVSPLSTSLIFSTEIIITMLLSPLQAVISGTVPDAITPSKAAGGVMIVLGLLITEPNFMNVVRKVLAFRPSINTSDMKRGVHLAAISAVMYFLMDVPVQLTGLLPVHTGIKTFLPFTLGLFFGMYGAVGCCLGCIAGSLALGSWPAGAAAECTYILVAGLGMFYGWHTFSGTHSVRFLKPGHYITYLLLVLVLSALSLDVGVAASYILTGIFIALPVNILLGSLLSVEPVLPAGYSLACDADFSLTPGAESLDEANSIFEESGEKHDVPMKRVFEIQSLLEELSIRIFGALPDTVINVRVIYGEAVSMKLSYSGAKYNPFTISAGDDVLDITGLKIIKHRALRASFSRRGSRNHVHVVV
ncbi:MAG: DMT family transporter [Synergistaceae bacterium]|nr:DMT family transporter [Synergistaceae bacterium]